MQDVLKRWSRVLVACACLLICAAGVRAQPADGGGATVVGTDVDQSGRAIAGASVALTNEATKAVQTVMTGSDGHFAATNLPGGSYAIEVSKSGFSTAKRAGVRPSDAELSIPLAVAELPSLSPWKLSRRWPPSCRLLETRWMRFPQRRKYPLPSSRTSLPRSPISTK